MVMEGAQLTGSSSSSITDHVITPRYIIVLAMRAGQLSSNTAVPLCMQLARTVNEVYHGYNRHQYPCVILNVTTSRGEWGKGCWMYFTIITRRFATSCKTAVPPHLLMMESE
jgi:hypothetical protein